MPAAPELGNVAAEVRIAEVAHQTYAEQLGGADGDVGIAGEVAVDLDGEEDGGQGQGAAAVVGVILEHRVDEQGTAVGHGNFLEQSPQYLAQAVHRRVIVEAAGVRELREQVGGPLDGSGHQLREETHEGEKPDDVAGGLKFSAIHVDAVAQRLEGVETDAHRQDKVKQKAVGVAVEKQAGKGLGEEIVVFEQAEDAEVENDVGNVYHLGCGLLPVALDEQSTAPAAQRGERDEEQEPPVPPSVEEIRNPYDEEVLHPHAAIEYQPVEQEHDGQEDGEFERVE